MANVISSSIVQDDPSTIDLEHIMYTSYGREHDYYFIDLHHDGGAVIRWKYTSDQKLSFSKDWEAVRHLGN